MPTVPLNKMSANTDATIVLFLMPHEMYMPCATQARQDERLARFEMWSSPPLLTIDHDTFI